MADLRMISVYSFCILLLCIQCKNNTRNTVGIYDGQTDKLDSSAAYTRTDSIQQALNQYARVDLTTDLGKLSAREIEMIPLLIEAAKIMDELFWKEAYGDKSALVDSLKDQNTREYTIINYGPWDRLAGNKTFVPGTPSKPYGAQFYPPDMTKEEFEAASFKDKNGLYSMVRRDDQGKLHTIPYHIFFKDEVGKASDLLNRAAALAEDPGLKKYLTLRARALLTDQYQASDLAWMDMKSNTLDVVIGPIETYEDQLYGYRAAHEAYILVKDLEWSRKLEKYAGLMPALQAGIPVDPKYKKEKPGSASDLYVYDAIYYSGDGNSGSKTIAINLPNDEEVQLKKGTRRLQLKNTIKAKFDQILQPISAVLIAPAQRQHITGDAFFENVMFHEVAHGLGIKNTINGKGTVREALKEHYSALEEGKADLLGLYMIKQLHDKGEIQGEMKDYIVTFMASIFRSIRFGASSAHGKANLIRFNLFQEQGAFQRQENGTYLVDFDKFDLAMEEVIKLILQIQGDGDYAAMTRLMNEKCLISPDLQQGLDLLAQMNIPVDIVFNQGLDVLGIKANGQ